MPRVKRAFGINNRGLAFHYDMQPDAQTFYRDMLSVDKQLHDHRKPFNWARAELIKDQHKTFALERDPLTLQPWAAWSPSYAIKRREGVTDKKGKPVAVTKKLVLGGTMYRTATAKSNWIIRKDTIRFNLAALFSRAPYFVFHQQDRLTTRGKVVVKASDRRMQFKAKSNFQKQYVQDANYRRDFNKLVARELVKQSKAGQKINKTLAQQVVRDAEINRFAGKEAEGANESLRGHHIPRRRFLGASPLARRNIERAFDEWAEGVVTFFERKHPTAGRLWIKRVR